MGDADGGASGSENVSGLEDYGGGGTGGYRSGSTGGAGGGGGGYTRSTLPVTPGDSIAYHVGGAGQGGQNPSAGDGQGGAIRLTYVEEPLAAPVFADDTGTPITEVVGRAISDVVVPAAAGFPLPTYAAASLPAGVTFDPATRTLSFDEDAIVVGSGTIRVTATNTEGSDEWTVAYAFTRRVSLFDVTALNPGDDGDVGVRWSQPFTAFATTPNDTRAHLIANNGMAGGVTPDTFEDQGGTTKRIDWLVLHHGRDSAILNLDSDISSASEEDYRVAFRERGGSGLWDFAVSSDQNRADPYEMPADQADLNAIVAVIVGTGTLDVIIYDVSVADDLPGWDSANLSYGSTDVDGSASLSARNPDIVASGESNTPVSRDGSASLSARNPDITASGESRPRDRDGSASLSARNPDITASGESRPRDRDGAAVIKARNPGVVGTGEANVPVSRDGAAVIEARNPDITAAGESRLLDRNGSASLSARNPDIVASGESNTPVSRDGSASLSARNPDITASGESRPRDRDGSASLSARNPDITASGESRPRDRDGSASLSARNPDVIAAADKIITTNYDVSVLADLTLRATIDARIETPPPPPILENIVQARIGGRYASEVETVGTLPDAGKILPGSLRVSKGTNTQGTASFAIIAHTDQLSTVKPTRNEEVVITARGVDEPLVEGHDFRSYLTDLLPTTFYSFDQGSDRGAVPAGFATLYVTPVTVDVPDASPYTVTSFIRITEASVRPDVAVSGRAQVPGSSVTDWHLTYSADRTIQLDTFAGGQRTRQTFASPVDLSDPLRFVQLTVRAAAGGFSVLVNGELLTPVAGGTTSASPPVSLAANTIQFSGGPAGILVDEVALWDSVVDADEIERLWSLRDVRRLFGGLVRESVVEPIGSSGDLSRITVTCKSFASRAFELKIQGYIRTDQNESVGELAKTIVNDHMVGEGISLDGVRDSTAIVGDVWDYISPAEAFTRICEQANAVWCIDDYKTLVIVGRDFIYDGGLSLHQSDFETPIVVEDDRLLRTVQTVIGGSPQSGQERQDFNGDGTTREFRLDFRIDRIFEVSVNGVSVPTGPGTDWEIDTRRSVIRQSESAIALSPSDTLSVLYNYNFPIVSTVEDAAAIALYGRIHAVEHDPSLDRVDIAEGVARSMLDRNNSPTLVLTTDIVRGKVSEVREGWGLRVTFGKLGYRSQLYLVDRVNTRLDGRVLQFGVELLARDFQPRFQDFYRSLKRRAVPTELTSRFATMAGEPGLTPDQIGIEGLRLPVVLGGTERSLHRGSSWVRVFGSSIARLNGDRLPSNLVEWYATAKVSGAGVTGQFRLFNRTTSQQVGLVVNVTATSPVIVFHRRITLTSGANDYELQFRCTSAVGRRMGVSGWGGTIDVGG